MGLSRYLTTADLHPPPPPQRHILPSLVAINPDIALLRKADLKASVQIHGLFAVLIQKEPNTPWTCQINI